MTHGQRRITRTGDDPALFSRAETPPKREIASQSFCSARPSAEIGQTLLMLEKAKKVSPARRMSVGIDLSSAHSVIQPPLKASKMCNLIRLTDAQVARLAPFLRESRGNRAKGNERLTVTPRLDRRALELGVT